MYLLQFLIPNQRYSSHYLRDLDGRPRLLAMCGLDEAPSEWAYCRFKKKLAKHRGRLRTVANRTARACAAEIERLREQGLVPEDAPRLGEMLAMDPTDVKAFATPVPEHCDNPERGKCTKKHRSHWDSPVPEECTKHTKRCTDPDARWGKRTPKANSGRTAGKDGKDKKKMEDFFGYKIHAVADAYYGIPLHLELRPAYVSENPRFAEDLDATLERHPWLRAKYVMADKGYDRLKNFNTRSNGASSRPSPRAVLERTRKPASGCTTARIRRTGGPVCLGGKPMSRLGHGSGRRPTTSAVRQGAAI